jgi:hypothetical protein
VCTEATGGGDVNSKGALKFKASGLVLLTKSQTPRNPSCAWGCVQVVCTVATGESDAPPEEVMRLGPNQVRFCRKPLFPFRRLRLQGDQARGELG